MNYQVLFVGTADNRYFIEYDSDDEMPNLINDNGSLFIQNEHPSDLEKNHTEIFNYLYTQLKGTIYYNTVDPSYSNNRKQKNDNTTYLGHYSCLLENLDSKLDNMYDLIVITNCYQDLFNTKNIDKIKSLCKSNNKIIIMSDVKYYISDYMKENLNYKFIYLG